MNKVVEIIYVVIALGVLFVLLGIRVVETGYRGVKVRFGEVIGEPKPEGLYFVNPITTKIIKMDVQTTKDRIRTECYTKDVIQSTVVIDIIYYAEPAKVHELYRTLGSAYAEKILDPNVLAALKDVVGKYEAADLIGERNKASSEIKERLELSLEGFGIKVLRVVLADIGYDRDLDGAFERVQIAKLDALAAKHRTAQIQEEAVQKVAMATAEAEVMRIRAEMLEKKEE